MALQNLYERIKDARERAGMSVNDASHALGVTRTQVWRLEHKSETLTAERLFELADLYGVDPRQLLRGDDPEVSSTAMLEHVGAVVMMVEETVQSLDVRPSPDLIRDAVIEVLRRESVEQSNASPSTFDPTRYKGLLALVFKQVKS